MSKQARTTESCWDSGQFQVEKCEFADEEYRPAIELPQLIHDKVLGMSQAMEHKEWLGYVQGKYLEKEQTYIIEDIFVPDQEVTGGSVVVKHDTPLPKNNIGTVHFHPMGGKFFSSTDDDYVASNHQICLTYSRDGYKAKVRYELPCKAKTLVDADIFIMTPHEEEVEKFVKEGQKHILEHTYAAPVYQATGGGSYYKTESPSIKNTDKKHSENFPVNWFCGHCRKKSSAMILVEGLWLCQECADKDKNFRDKGIDGYGYWGETP